MSIVRSALVLAALLPLATSAACPKGAAIKAYVADIQAMRPSKGFGKDLGMADAKCARGKLIQALPQALGRPVGYKAAFTNPAVQQRFGIRDPAWAAMFANGMVEGDAKLPAQFGAVPRYEADLIAVVADAGLADAATPLEALRHISEFVAFIELPDLMLEGTPTAAELIATNIGFRGGVLGRRIKVEASQQFFDALGGMNVVVRENGQETARVKGDALLGHPANAALWLARALKKDGIALKPGDLLSLGGYTTPTAVRSGLEVTVRYEGLPGDPEVSAHFE